MTAIDHLLVLVFAVLYPTYAFWGYRRIRADLVANKPGVRTSDYRETSALLWALAAAALAAWIYQGRSLLDLGLGLPSRWPAWLGLALVALLGAYLWLQVRRFSHDEEQRRRVREKLGEVAASEFLPRTKKELNGFIVLSISAGVCEEILFRGFLIWYFDQIGGTILAIFSSSLLFGLAHSYQGRQGVVKAGSMGLVMALCYVFSGSLWVVIFLHIIGDIYSGQLGWFGFNVKEADSALGEVEN